MPRTARQLGLLGLLACLAWGAQAEDGQAAQMQALRKAQGLLRQLMEEKAALQAENAKLKQEGEEAKKKLSKLETELGVASNGLVRAQATQAELNEKLQGESAERSRLSQSYGSLQGLQQKTAASLGQYRHDHSLLLGALKEREEWIARCGEANQKLLALQEELAARYDGKSLWDVLRQGEPLTGIAAVTAENAAQSYRFKREDLRVPAFQGTEPAIAVPASASE